MVQPRILRLNMAGQPIEWLLWQEAVCLFAREMVVWTLGDVVKMVKGAIPALMELSLRLSCLVLLPVAESI